MDKNRCLEILNEADKMLYEELEDLTKHAFTSQSFKELSEVVDALKDVATIRAMKEDREDEEHYYGERVMVNSRSTKVADKIRMMMRTAVNEQERATLQKVLDEVGK